METPTELFSCAPDVSPGDMWGDAECLAREDQGPAPILPPKRAKREKPGRSSSATDRDGGLRIDSRSYGPNASQSPSKLVVREIDGDVVRLHPEEPETPRMPRQVVFQEKPDRLAELETAVETREWGRSKKQPVLWLLGIGIAVAAIVVSAIYQLPNINKPNEPRANQRGPAMEIEPLASAGMLNDMLARKAEARRVLKSFANASSEEDIRPLVREPEAVIGLIRAAPSRLSHSLTIDEPVKLLAWGAREQQSLTYGLLKGSTADFSVIETYFVLSQGRLVMDWKASTAYGTADFSELTENRGNPAEIRGWIEAAEYYSMAFPENSHQSYQLASPDKQRAIWTYARRGSGPHQTLDALIKGGYIIKGRPEPRKVTVRLAPGPAGSLPGQWEIVELLHKEWIAP